MKILRERTSYADQPVSVVYSAPARIQFNRAEENRFDQTAPIITFLLQSRMR